MFTKKGSGDRVCHMGQIKRSGKVWFSVAVLVVLLVFPSSRPVCGQSAGEADDQKSQVTVNWDEFMHYALIGKFDASQSYGQALLDMNPDPRWLLELAESDRYHDQYRQLYLMEQNTPLQAIASQILRLVEEGRYLVRTDQERIAAEVKRLSGTTRGRMLALSRLKDSGEWAVPSMIEAIRDPERGEEIAVLRWALPQMGKSVVEPLVVVLQQSRNLNVRLVVLDVLGKLGYQHAFPYIQEVIESGDSVQELKDRAKEAFSQIDRQQQMWGRSAAELYEQLSENYYDHLPSLELQAQQERGNVWFWDKQKGLYMEEVPRGAYDELMTMRCAEYSVRLDRDRAEAISLWLSGFFRMESQGYDQPGYFGSGHADAATYALTAGPEYLQRVLYRALKNRNRSVALAAVRVLERNSSQPSLLYQVGSTKPLMETLTYPDREIRYSGALAIGGALPEKDFQGSEQVVEILAESLVQKGDRYVMLVDPDDGRRNKLASELKESGGFKEVVSDVYYPMAVEKTARVANIDLVVLSYDIQSPSLEEAVSLLKANTRLGYCPIVVLSSRQAGAVAERLQENNSFVGVLTEGSAVADIVELANAILSRNQSHWFDEDLANLYALKSSEVLRSLAVTKNPVLSLASAEKGLIRALREERQAIQFNAVQTLGRLDSMEAQRALCKFSLDASLGVELRLLGLGNLAISSKMYGNLLTSDQVEALYSQMVQSREIDVQLRELAAEAYGALNLPSVTISELILEQAQ